MNWEPSNASVLPPSTLTYPAAAIGLSVLPSGLALPNNELAAGKSYGLVIVTSSESCGLLICAGQKTDVQLLQTSDQNGLPIFWSGVINGSAAGWYASLGSYVDNVHQLGWYGDDSGGHGTHGYSFINRWGSAPFDVGAAAAFHGNPILIKPLQAPTLLTMASSSASRVFSLTPPGSGNYTLTINGETTGAIAAADTPSQVQTMLQNLPGLSGIAVDTSGIMGSDWPVLITVPAGLGAITASGATLAETTLQSGTTYYYVATAVANDETETVIGSQVSCTPTAAEPSVELVVTQDWGMSHARIYRSTSDGGPYSLIWILNPENPMSYGDHQVGIGVLDNGLIPQVDVPPTAPTPTSSVWQAWSGEPPSNVKLEGQDFAGTSQWSISAGGHFTGSNVGSALKTTPLYKQSHSVDAFCHRGHPGLVRHLLAGLGLLVHLPVRKHRHHEHVLGSVLRKSDREREGQLLRLDKPDRDDRLEHQHHGGDGAHGLRPAHQGRCDHHQLRRVGGVIPPRLHRLGLDHHHRHERFVRWVGRPGSDEDGSASGCAGGHAGRDSHEEGSGIDVVAWRRVATKDSRAPITRGFHNEWR